MNYNTIADFQLEIKNRFKKFISKTKPSFKEFCFPKSFKHLYSQLFPAEYIKTYKCKRLLLNQRIGAGKTCTGIIIGEMFKHKKRIIFVAPSALISNVYKELISECTGNEYISTVERQILKNTDVASKRYQEIYEKCVERISEYYDILSYYKFIDQHKKLDLDNCIIIIDEAHNIISETGSFYKQFKTIFDEKLSSKSVVILMTATPIYDKPSELGLLFNLLGADLPIGHKFNETFIDGDKLINIDQLVQQIYKITSYFRGAPEYTFPQMQLKYVKCEMSRFQLGCYKIVIKNETLDIIDKKSNRDLLSLPDNFILGPRLISNIAYPNKKTGEAGYNSLDEIIQSRKIGNTDANMNFIYKLSCKFYRLLKKINKPGIHFIYSNFKECGGIKPLIKFLELIGFTNFLTNDLDSPKFAIWSSDESDKDKLLIRETINNISNYNGSLIKIIIGSPSIKEGVSFLRIRYVHLLEPYWNWSRMEQIIGRAIRFCSHKDVDEKIVKVYVYVAISDKKNKEKSADQYILEMANYKKILVDQFNDLLKNIAIDKYLY